MFVNLSPVLQISGSWIFGPFLCDMWTSSDVLCCTASILHLLAIALDRSELVFASVIQSVSHKTFNLEIESLKIKPDMLKVPYSMKSLKEF